MRAILVQRGGAVAASVLAHLGLIWLAAQLFLPQTSVPSPQILDLELMLAPAAPPAQAPAKVQAPAPAQAQAHAPTEPSPPPLTVVSELPAPPPTEKPERNTPKPPRLPPKPRPAPAKTDRVARVMAAKPSDSPAPPASPTPAEIPAPPPAIPDQSVSEAPLSGPPQIYPPAMQALGREGSVSLNCLIDIAGMPQDCQVLSVSGGSAFANAALRLMQARRYRPASHNGVAVPVRHAVTVTYRLGN